MTSLKSSPSSLFSGRQTGGLGAVFDQTPPPPLLRSSQFWTVFIFTVFFRHSIPLCICISIFPRWYHQAQPDSSNLSVSTHVSECHWHVLLSGFNLVLHCHQVFIQVRSNLPQEFGSRNDHLNNFPRKGEGGLQHHPSIHHPLSSIQYYCNHCYYAPLQRSTLMKHMRGRIDHLNNFPNTMFHHQLPSIILWKSSKIQVRPELIRYCSISASIALLPSPQPWKCSFNFNLRYLEFPFCPVCCFQPILHEGDPEAQFITQFTGSHSKCYRAETRFC